MTTATQQSGIRRTVMGVVLLIGLMVAGFVVKVTQPRPMSDAELRVNGAVLLETPKTLPDVTLTDHTGQPFGPSRWAGPWTLVFPGYTHCPDICPTTMATLREFRQLLDERFRENTRVVMLSVDPARDTPETLETYVTYFDPTFIGLTGDFLKVHRFASGLHMTFQKVPITDGDTETYLIDHSASIALINPKGDYHAFFKPTRRQGAVPGFDAATLALTYKGIRARWRH